MGVARDGRVDSRGIRAVQGLGEESFLSRIAFHPSLQWKPLPGRRRVRCRLWERPIFVSTWTSTPLRHRAVDRRRRRSGGPAHGQRNLHRHMHENRMILSDNCYRHGVYPVSDASPRLWNRTYSTNN